MIEQILQFYNNRLFFVVLATLLAYRIELCIGQYWAVPILGFFIKQENLNINTKYKLFVDVQSNNLQNTVIDEKNINTVEVHI